MRRHRAFRVASWLALVAWVATTLCALLIAGAGTAGLTGATDYRYRISIIPTTHLLDLTYQPSWGVQAGGMVCRQIRITDPQQRCDNIVLQDARGQRLADGVVLQSDVRPVSAHVDGRLLLDAERGWNPLIASLYGMTVLSLIVLAFLLSQLWLLLRAASRDAPFTEQVVRRLRVVGVILIAWEVAEPVLWLFFSPKAWDYGLVSYGGGMDLQLTSMEPGGPQLTVIAFGVLLVLLAEVFRRGVHLETEQKFTV
ncbi:MAG: DUF2975 domain-containing protein [Nocardioidaceae bacterium]